MVTEIRQPLVLTKNQKAHIIVLLHNNINAQRDQALLNTKGNANS